MQYDIRLKTLSDEDADRIEARHPRLNLDPSKYCPTCKKAGLYVWRGTTVSCDCTGQLSLYKHYLAAGIPTDYHILDWDDLLVDSPSKAMLVEKLRDYMDLHDRYIQRGVGLFFSGPNGVGKTLLATLTLKDFVKKGYFCFYSTMKHAINTLVESKGSDYFQRKFMDSEILLVDDVGKEYRNQLSSTTFDDILRTRVQEGKSTFLTTNLTPADIVADYGVSILSLLKEKSIYHEFDGTDFRLKSNRRMLDEIAAGETRPIV